MLKKYFQIILISIILFISCYGVTPAYASTPFIDVPTSHWAYVYIDWMSNIGVTKGCKVDPPKYCPDAPVSRAEMAVFIIRSFFGASYEPPTVSSTSFYDTASHWAAGWIEQFATLGITTGCGGGNYCPDAPVSRAEMAVFLLRSRYGKDKEYFPDPLVGDTGFSDVPNSHWASAWIKQLADEGITTGCQTDPPKYCPSAPVTRAQMAVFLERAIGYEWTFESFGDNINCEAFGENEIEICAAVSNSSPEPFSDVYVYARLLTNSGHPFPTNSKKIASSYWHFKEGTEICDMGFIDAGGFSFCKLNIGNSTIDYTVNIDVTIYGYTVTTSFTPSY